MAEDRQAEGRLGDEEIAAHRLEGHAGGIRPALVVARDDDPLAGIFHHHLGRAQDMAGRGEGELDPAELEPVAVVQGLQAGARFRPEAGAHDLEGV